MRHRGVVEALAAQATVLNRDGVVRVLREQAAILEGSANRPTEERAILSMRLSQEVVEGRQEAWEAANAARLRLEEHGRERPTGRVARLTGALARWAAEHRPLQREVDQANIRLDQARAAEDRARARLLPEVRREAAGNRALNAEDIAQAASLRATAQRLMEGHLPMLSELGRRPLRLSRSSLSVDDIGRLRSAAAMDEFAFLEGEGFTAVARFFREWSSSMSKAMRR